MPWFVYLARCGDGTLYCGITNDLVARLAAHNAGKGAKYTRRRGPISLVYRRRCRDKGSALRWEYRIKQLRRAQKEALVLTYNPDDVAKYPRRRSGRLERGRGSTTAVRAHGR